MLLQTFLQLHILLAATPALAGWTLFVPVVGQGAPVRILSISRATANAVHTPALRVSVATAAQSPVNPDPHLVNKIYLDAVSTAGVERSIVRSVGVSSSAQSPRAP